MATGWKTLGRKDLATFDKFGKQAVLTAMKLGGIGRITNDGHARIKGLEGDLTVSRDNSAPHCQGNVLSTLRKAFPELKTNGATKKEDTMNDSPTSQAMYECPAKGCEEKYLTVEERNAHIDADHVVCKEPGCNFGPDGGPYVGRTKQAMGGHVNVYHRGFKPWEKNIEKAAINRAKAIAARKTAEAAVDRVLRNDDDDAAQQIAPPKSKSVAASNGYVVGKGEDNTTDTGGPVTVISTRQAGAGRVTGEDVVSAEDAEAKATLALIRELLGDDEEVARLKKQVADLKAQLALIREAVGLDFGDDDSNDNNDNNDNNDSPAWRR